MIQRPKFRTAVIFIALTFLITWGINVPLALAAHHIIRFSVHRWVEIMSTLSPGIVALLITAVQLGKISLKDLLLQIVKWRVNLTWYIFAVFIPALAVAASLWIYHIIFHQSVDASEWYLPLILFFIFIPFSPLWEEIGLRGFLLPILQSKFHLLLAAVILGLIWGIWHIPMYLVHNPKGNRTGLFLVFFISGTIPLKVLFAWLFNNTKGSLFLTIVFHSAINATFSLFSKLPTGALRPFIYTMALVSLTAIFIIWKTKGRLAIPIHE